MISAPHCWSAAAAVAMWCKPDPSPEPGALVQARRRLYGFLHVDGLKDSLGFCQGMVTHDHVGVSPGWAFSLGDARDDSYLRICFAQDSARLEQRWNVWKARSGTSSDEVSRPRTSRQNFCAESAGTLLARAISRFLSHISRIDCGMSAGMRTARLNRFMPLALAAIDSLQLGSHSVQGILFQGRQFVERFEDIQSSNLNSGFLS